MQSSESGGKITDATCLDQKQEKGELYLRTAQSIVNFFSLVGDMELPGRSRANRTRLTRLFINLIYVLYICCSLKMLISLWYSYEHDNLLYGYKRFCSQQSGARHCCEANLANCLYFGPTLAKYQESLKEARANAKRVGAPLLQASFGSEITYLAILIFAFYTIVVGRLYLLSEKIDSDLAYVLLDKKNGQKLVNKIITKVSEKLIPTDEGGLGCTFHAVKCNLPSSVKLTKKVTGRYEQQVKHKPILFHLRCMALSGEIKPFNRRSAWMINLCRIFCWIFLGTLFYLTSLMFVIIFGTATGMVKNVVMETDLMDLVMLADILTVFSIYSFSLALYLSLIALNLFDQILTAKKLIREQRTYVNANETRFRAQGDSSVDDRVIDYINRNLLQLFVQYRIFVHQTRYTMRLQGSFLFLVAQAVSFGPLLLYLHAPYMDQKLMIVAASTMTVILSVVGIFWLPSCYFYSRCEDLYKSLFSLRAHISQLQTDLHKDCFDWHLVDLLSRELKDPNKLLDQFAIKRFGFTFNYENFLIYYFWQCIALTAAYTAYRRGGSPSNLLPFL